MNSWFKTKISKAAPCLKDLRSFNVMLSQLNIYLIMIILTVSCSGKEETRVSNSNTLVMNNIEWSLLETKKIFFGHQSVGNGVLKGIDSLMSDTPISKINIVLTRDTSDFGNPIFAHSKIGKNLDPKSKIDDFANILESGIGSNVDIAMMKLCYVDFNKNTDIPQLFNYYQVSINKLKTQFPELYIVHWTVPLTDTPKGIKGMVKKIIKMDGNPYRHKFNELLRQNYSQDEIFDIAAYESTFPDGTQNLYMNGTPGLISDYTSDGGHLNERGKRIIAYHLLEKLTHIN